MAARSLGKYEHDMLNRLKEITKDCRDDMHEPDEHGLVAHVVGQKLDNAFGDSIDAGHIVDGFQELVVVITADGPTHRKECFNLASLIALARKAEL